MFVAVPPLSIDNIMAVLGGLAGKWDEVGDCLHVPEAIRRAIKQENTEDEARFRAVLMYWILRDPVASWRKLMWQLRLSSDQNLNRAADSIRHYAEKLSGQFVCDVCDVCCWVMVLR